MLFSLKSTHIEKSWLKVAKNSASFNFSSGLSIITVSFYGAFPYKTPLSLVVVFDDPQGLIVFGFGSSKFFGTKNTLCSKLILSMPSEMIVSTIKHSFFQCSGAAIEYF